MENVSVIEFYAIGRSQFKFDEVGDFAERGPKLNGGNNYDLHGNKKE